MSNINEKCLEVFPNWLSTLPNDVGIILQALKSEGLNLEAKRILLGSINYLFKSLDLIPDEVDDLGYLDDAFVLRLSAEAALEQGLGDVPDTVKLELDSLAKGTGLLKEFFDTDIYRRFAQYVTRLRTGAARGRTVDELVESHPTYDSFVKEIENFISGFRVPNFERDENNLIKLAAFFDARLPK